MYSIAFKMKSLVVKKKLPEKIDFHAKFSAIFEVKIANIFTKRKNLWKMRENEKNAKKTKKECWI